MGLLDTLGEIVAALDRAGIPHMVAGSVASTYYSEPRTTQDIDIVIDPDQSSLRRFVAGLDHDRYYMGDAEGAFAQRSQFNVIDITSGWKIDLMLCRDRPFSRTELERRQRVDIEGLQVHVASPEDTILAKLEWGATSGSERQRRDVSAIVRSMREELDLGYLRRWAGELGVADALDELLHEPDP
ncbi:hypothetical protein BH24ACT3_BH24ACT3_16480 [soil metagenome]